MKTRAFPWLSAILLTAFLSPVAPALAEDFSAAMRAYEQQDYRQAYSLFGTLAAAGDHDAQYMLGRHYETGNGVLQDFVEAHKWYNLAAAGGHRHASGARDALAARMTANQIAEAQQRARQWQPSTAAPSPPTIPAQPTQREVVAGIQRELNRLGYDAGPVDGLMGQRTRNAINDYQADAGLPVDGQPSLDLLVRLESAAPVPPPTAALPPTAAPPIERPESWHTVFRDDFSDPERSRRHWTVVSGEFSIAGGAMRTVVQPQRGVRIPESGRAEDIGIAILETIIGQTTGQRPSEPGPAEIYLAEDFGERFRIELELLSRQPFGELLIGPYRGNRRDGGYRLRYTPDGDTTLALLTATGDGERVIARSSRRITLEDGRRHLLTWTRNRNGDMEIELNEQPLFSVNDPSDGHFRGLSLLNHSGDFSVYRLRIDTVR